MDVREVRPEEFEEAGRVTALAYREFVRDGDEAWERYVAEIADVADRARRTTVLVAVDEGRILGSASLELRERVDPVEDPPLEEGEAHLRMLGVDPDARGRGVARTLVRECLDRARAAGRTRLTLHTTERMDAARALYESMGFRRLPDRVLDDGFVLLTYVRGIEPA